jgi:hypothetical protein
LPPLSPRPASCWEGSFPTAIFGTFERLTLLLAFGIPPAAAAAAYLLLFGWLIAFVLNFLRHQNFFLRRRSRSLYVSSGLFTLREYSIALRDINYLISATASFPSCSGSARCSSTPSATASGATT